VFAVHAVSIIFTHLISTLMLRHELKCRLIHLCGCLICQINKSFGRNTLIVLVVGPRKKAWSNKLSCPRKRTWSWTWRTSFNISRSRLFLGSVHDIHASNIDINAQARTEMLSNPFMWMFNMPNQQDFWKDFVDKRVQEALNPTLLRSAATSATSDPRQIGTGPSVIFHYQPWY
jgi:hypothetical protein